MRPLSVWLTLILIASALVLSGARNFGAESRALRGTQHKQATTEKTQPTEYQKPEASVPLSVLQTTQWQLSEALHALSAQEKAPAQNERTQKDMWDKASVIASYLLFIVAALYTLFAWGQWCEMSSQVSAMRLQVRAQMDADRPWVSLRERDLLDWKINGDFPPRLTFKIFNYGRGMCFMETARWCLDVFEGNPLIGPDMPKDPDYSKARCSLKKWGGIAIQPQEKFPGFDPLGKELTEELFDDVRRLRKTLAFYGVIEYRDNFKRRHKHGFCSVYLPSGAYGDQPIWNDIGGPDTYRYETTEEA